MDTIFATPKWLVAISAMIVIFLGGILVWQTHSQHQWTALSEKQTIWLLIGLSVIAMLSMGIFLFTILG